VAMAAASAVARNREDIRTSLVIVIGETELTKRKAHINTLIITAI